MASVKPSSLFEYDGDLYPEYLKQGNAMQFIRPVAEKFCQGYGADVGCGLWPLPGSIPIDLQEGGEATRLPFDVSSLDYVFSSHCLEHLPDPIRALEHWRSRLKLRGVLFLYLPHPDQKYWRPQRCRKHLHSWQPEVMAQILSDLGLHDVLHSTGHDLAWSFTVVGTR